MTGLNIVPLQDVITARVKELVPAVTVFEDSPPDDKDLPFDTVGRMKPYVVLRYSPIRPSYSGRSMGGPRHDEYLATVDIVAVSEAGRTSRSLNAYLVDELIGFKPDGVSPLHQRTDSGDPAPFTVSNNESRPTQYGAASRLRFTVNATSTPAVG